MKNGSTLALEMNQDNSVLWVGEMRTLKKDLKVSTRQSAYCCQVAENSISGDVSQTLQVPFLWGAGFLFSYGQSMQTEMGGTSVSPTVSVFTESSLAFFRGCHAPLRLFF